MLYKSSLSSFARRTGADRSPAGLPVTSLRANPSHDTTPLPALNDPKAVAPIPSHPAADSVYGHQSSVAAAGTNLAAGGGHVFAPDPNADLGHAPAALASYERVPAAYTTFPAHSSPLGFAYFGASNGLLHDTFLVALHGANHSRIEKSSTNAEMVANRPNNTVTTSRPGMAAIRFSAAPRPVAE
jgi:hypothetical protein